MKHKICYICPSGKFVDDHHIDCCEGKLSPETVPLCRRCHRTYHDIGVEWFDDEYLDKAIELENRRRQIVNDKFKSPTIVKTTKGTIMVEPLELLKREDIKRTDYFNKTHGLPQTRETKGSRTPAFAFHLPNGEPLCGQQWVHDHMYDYIGWAPRIEVLNSDLPLLSTNIDSAKKLKQTIKVLRGLRNL